MYKCGNCNLTFTEAEQKFDSETGNYIACPHCHETGDIYEVFACSECREEFDIDEPQFCGMCKNCFDSSFTKNIGMRYLDSLPIKVLREICFDDKSHFAEWCEKEGVFDA